MSKEEKSKKRKNSPTSYSQEEADEYRALHLEEMDQWKILRKILSYALLIIEKPTRLPEWGFIRLFSDIYNEHKALDWSELDATKINLLEKDIHRFNLARNKIDNRYRLLLKKHGIELYKLRFCPERE